MPDSVTSVVLKNIYRHGPLTRQELREHTQMSASSLRPVISDLIVGKKVVERTASNDAPGRPPALLSINPAIGYAVGLDIGGRHSRGVLTDLTGTALSSVIHRTKIVQDQNTIIQGVTDLIDETCRAGGIAPAQTTAIGIGVQGIVNTRTGFVLDWPNTPSWSEAWRGLDLPGAIHERIGIRPLIDDSVRGMARVVHQFGAARKATDFLYLFLGNGIGAGVFIDGELYAGTSGIAGELGHVAVEDSGPYCSCGNSGCLEVMASTSAVLRRAKERLQEARLMSTLRDPHSANSLTLNDIIDAAHRGDKVAFQLLDETGAYIGKAVAIGLNLLAPQLVVLGGPLARAGDMLLDAVKRQVRLRALQYVSEHTDIVCDDPGEFAGAQGTAILALDALFSSDEGIRTLLQ